MLTIRTSTTESWLSSLNPYHRKHDLSDD